MTKPDIFVDIDSLRIGHYVHLDVSWLDHPFPFSHFRIKNAEQIRTLRGLGLSKLRVDLAKSEVIQDASPPEAAPPETQAESADQAIAMARKRERIEQNQALRARISVTEKKFVETAKVCKEIGRTIFSSPGESVARAQEVVSRIADALLADSEAIIHLLGDKIAGEEVYHHSLNVATLAVLLGKQLGISRDIIEQVGLATILHDLGKVEVPSRVLLKKEAWNAPERELFQTHVMHSVAIANKAGVSKEILQIIAQHHEMLNGSGYPAGLSGDKLSVGGKLLGLVNAYDNLCNPIDIATALTPHESLSLMFTKKRPLFDNLMLSKLVHLLGVYPPGTVVALSNDVIGMVISINSAKPLRPTVMIYDPDIPRAEAVTINLEEEKEINISKALRPGQLARPVYDYLSPRQRITYSFDDTKGKASP